MRKTISPISTLLLLLALACCQGCALFKRDKGPNQGFDEFGEFDESASFDEFDEIDRGGSDVTFRGHGGNSASDEEDKKDRFGLRYLFSRDGDGLLGTESKSREIERSLGI